MAYLQNKYLPQAPKYNREYRNPSAQIAKHLRDVHFGGNWTFSNLKEALAGVTWQQATTQVYSLNTIVRMKNTATITAIFMALLSIPIIIWGRLF